MVLEDYFITQRTILAISDPSQLPSKPLVLNLHSPQLMMSCVALASMVSIELNGCFSAMGLGRGILSPLRGKKGMIDRN